MNFLVRRDDDGGWDVPRLGGIAYATGEGFAFDGLAGGKGGDQAHIVVRGGGPRALDAVLTGMHRSGVPHNRLTRRYDGYVYAPWDLLIECEERHPAGSTWITEWGGETLVLPYLRNFRGPLARLHAAS